ncbi:MAG: phosphoribosylanthranilate isomerase [Desulfomonile tiedjei]|nr:phosphoribosylanthranilate isomerase [Desulfomonile tiedjei]
MSSLEEALFCCEVGVGALGFTLGLPDGFHDNLTEDKARSIIAKLPQSVLPVLITYISAADEACRLVRHIGAAAVQFHGGIANEELFTFRKACPDARMIGRVTVDDESALERAGSFKPPLWDAIILDSFDPGTGRRGATGMTHDWSISAEIVQRSSLPVILAGGLNPDNVAEAVLKVRPAAVDAHTGLEEAGGARSPAKIKAFAETALKAFDLLSPIATPPQPF